MARAKMDRFTVSATSQKTNDFPETAALRSRGFSKSEASFAGLDYGHINRQTSADGQKVSIIA
jgi:hypothetical protein